MPLSPPQQRVLEEWMHSKGIVECPACADHDRWRLDEAAYVRALLEEGEADLTESGGVVKIPCGNCAYVALFDAETIGIRDRGPKGGTSNMQKIRERCVAQGEQEANEE